MCGAHFPDRDGRGAARGRAWREPLGARGTSTRARARCVPAALAAAAPRRRSDRWRAARARPRPPAARPLGHLLAGAAGGFIANERRGGTGRLGWCHASHRHRRCPPAHAWPCIDVHCQGTAAQCSGRRGGVYAKDPLSTQRLSQLLLVDELPLRSRVRPGGPVPAWCRPWNGLTAVLRAVRGAAAITPSAAISVGPRCAWLCSLSGRVAKKTRSAIEGGTGRSAGSADTSLTRGRVE